MDKVDKALINMLQENARMTISEMSKRASLSMPAISERVKKLEASGIIKQYTAIINPEKVNKGIEALMFACFASKAQERDFLDSIGQETDVKECFEVTGDFDYCLKIITESTEALEKLICRVKEKGTTKTNVSIVLSTVMDRPTIQLSEE